MPQAAQADHAAAPEVAEPAPPLLAVSGLSIGLTIDGRRHAVVSDVSLTVRAGEIVALVGESGSGKSLTALAILGLLPAGVASVTGGSTHFEGAALTGAAIRSLRGRRIGLVFQEPASALNPVLSIGTQLIEPMIHHLGLDRATARRRAVALLAEVGITDPAERLAQYPHQLSGGMKQRVMIAMALACDPALIIADEPTTALDVTIQAQILELLAELGRSRRLGVLLITHNLGVVARHADRVEVMYAGRIVERGATATLFAHPAHPYTAGLLAAVPRLDRSRSGRLGTIDGQPPPLTARPAGCRFAPRCPARFDRCEREPPLLEVAASHEAACHRAGAVQQAAIVAEPAASRPEPGRETEALLSVSGLSKLFPVRRGGHSALLRAVDDVGFSLARGETLALVGESGCGKTTVARLLLGLERPTAGAISFRGERLDALPIGAARRARRRMQVIFQDPYASLNPRMTIGAILAEPLLVHGLAATRTAARARAAELLALVGLPEEAAARHPHQLSGGQRQRVGIARALATEPDLVICDEPVSSLDVSIQGQIVNLLADLQARLGLAYLFIGHDLAVVRHIADRVAVMYLGRIVEEAPADAFFAAPRHPYSRALIAAAPVPDPAAERARPIARPRAEPPSPLAPPPGCAFHPRCDLAEARCRAARPEAVRFDRGWAACFRAGEVAA